MNKASRSKKNTRLNDRGYMSKDFRWFSQENYKIITGREGLQLKEDSICGQNKKWLSFNLDIW